MSTIFKTRISQQEVQAPTVSADRVVTDNFITSSIQSESVASENINATTVQGEEIIANDLSTENIAISNDLSIGQDVIVPSGNVLVGRKGIVSFVDDGEEVDENGASGFPIYNGVPEVLNNSTVYNIGEVDKDIDLSNIRFGGNDNMVQTCEIWFSTPADTARSIGDTYEITWPENVVWLDSTDGNAPAIVKGTEYRIVLRKENEQIVASIAYAIGEGQQSVDEMIRDAAQKDGDNTFTGANTFTGSVDMSTAQVTPPSGWNVGELTAEAIQAVVPMSWVGNSARFGTASKANAANGTAIGVLANASHTATSIGFGSSANNMFNVAVGANASNNKMYSLTIGYAAIATGAASVTVGAQFEDTSGVFPCTTEGTGSITIGAGANTLNTTKTVDGVETTVESSNAITIGCKASNSGADAVVIGAQARGTAGGGVCMGVYAKVEGAGGTAVGGQAEAKNAQTVAVGKLSKVSGSSATAVGARSSAAGMQALALGPGASASSVKSVAIGSQCTAADTGAVVFRSTAGDDIYTQLYFSGANTPLANQYYNGEAMMGYTVTDPNTKQVLACGTRRLSELFPDNSLTQPASLDENGEWVMPEVFHPSDLDLPVEEPTKEPEDVTINIPEPTLPEAEEYIPLPVYPIVEPELEEI